MVHTARVAASQYQSSPCVLVGKHGCASCLVREGSATAPARGPSTRSRAAWLNHSEEPKRNHHQHNEHDRADNPVAGHIWFSPCHAYVGALQQQTWQQYPDHGAGAPDERVAPRQIRLWHRVPRILARRSAFVSGKGAHELLVR